MPSRERRDGVEAEEWIAPRPLLLAKLILSMAGILDGAGFISSSNVAVDIVVVMAVDAVVVSVGIPSGSTGIPVMAALCPSNENEKTSQMSSTRPRNRSW